MASQTVLVIEDSDEVRETIVQLLSEHGFRTIAAEDTEHALALLDARVVSRPNVILLDVAARTQTAGALQRRLAQEHGALANVPIIVISGRSRDRLKVFAAGERETAFTSDALLDLVRRHASTSSS